MAGSMSASSVVGGLSLLLLIAIGTVTVPRVHMLTKDADCEICNSPELLRLRALYQEYNGEANNDELASDAASDMANDATPDVAADLALLSALKPRTGRLLLEADETGDLSIDDLKRLIETRDGEISKAKIDLRDLKIALDRQQMEVDNLQKMLDMTKDFKTSELKDYREKTGSTGMSEKTKEFMEQCKNNLVTELTSKENKDWAIYKGYACEATEAELKQYMNYELRGLCPDDWFFVQHLIFVRNCFALPKRRCLTRTPQSFVEPLPRHQAIFNQNALSNAAVRWDQHSCQSFDCLNKRSSGDCKRCFNLTLEAHRWQVNYRGAITIKEVIKMKRGGLRLGLDAGRGTGSFAAHMARYNVTVLTMAMNIETRTGGVRTGLPYMETIALRGLIPLHVPLTSRLPFFDNTLDVVHCASSVKFLPLGEFEDLLYEWDRILRVGGILWFELFYAPVDDMKIYVQLVELLKYKKLYWNRTPKPLSETKGKAHEYLNFVIEKQPRVDA